MISKSRYGIDASENNPIVSFMPAGGFSQRRRISGRGYSNHRHKQYVRAQSAEGVSEFTCLMGRARYHDAET
jgi:hypothetical protein